MPKAVFLVRAVVDKPLREKFDHWYATDHLPWAVKVFQCEKAWRFWSTVEEGVHYVAYRFADMEKLKAVINPEGLKPLIADFDRNFPTGVTRSRDILTMVDERGA